MKKIFLSTIALGLIGSSLSATTLYEDEQGQVFTKPAEGRTLVKSSTPVYAKATKLKFSGTTYIGYIYRNYKADTARVDYKDDESDFEIRRAYFQLKAYLLDDPKSYYRVTLDAHQNSEDDLVIRTKYAYLYLNNILPFTGLEVGLVHRPWHDYEEHNAWYFRNIGKVFLEDGNGAHLSNSADFGFNFKTKTQYFDSEFGIFNGEGYHSDTNDDDTGLHTGMSFEWRTTAHVMGVNGKDKQTKKRYFDVSFFGQYNKEHKTQTVGTKDYYNDLVFFGLHTVYNTPSYLISAQYINSVDTADNSTYVSSESGSGISLNCEYRFGHNLDYRAFGRYDTWTPKQLNSSDEKEQTTYIGGVAWEQNRNVQWVANITVTDNEKGSSKENTNGSAYMLSAEVKF